MPAISVSSVLTAEELRQHGVASIGTSGTIKSGDPCSRISSSSSSSKNGKRRSNSSCSNSSGSAAVGVVKGSVYRRSSAASSGSPSPHPSTSPRRRQQQNPPASGSRKLSYTEAYLGCMRTAGSAEPSPSSTERKLEKNKRFFNLRSMSENRLGKGKAKAAEVNKDAKIGGSPTLGWFRFN
ncbi:hypothetical protein RRG08_025236 [Elysia crispata]|uniref:Uncharacterized protein n=1 Tax=Elysia crispata TaxID=231223 RepID=A0AAE1AAK6_9GAST|nr:hypothetical protein RRG08_025236 [Elysia crispata]